MTSVLISSDNENVSNQIAKQVGETLGYDYVGDELLANVAEKHGISERDIRRTLGPDSRGLRKPSKRLKASLVYLEAALSERLLSDNIVIDGLGAHLHIRGIAHILNIRILWDVRSLTHRLAVEKKISPKAARKIMERREKQVQQWSLSTFGVDETSPSSYDMVISLGNIDEERAVKTISDMAKDRKFQPMTYSLKCLDNLALADRVSAALVSSFPKVNVTAQDSTVKLQLSKRWFGWQDTVESLRDIVSKVNGVEGIEIHTSALPSEMPWADASNA